MTEKEVLERIEKAGREKATGLYLGRRGLTGIPAEMGQLTHLQSLYLHNNQLTSVPAELGQLKDLQTLYLCNNQLTSIPVEIWQLANLRGLYLHNNQLTSVPAEVRQLTNLQELSLEGNQLTSIPAEMGSLTNLRKLNLNRNPGLKSPPPEIVTRGTDAVLNYLKSMYKEDVCSVHEAKLLIVGQGGVGKTCLMKRLMVPEKEIDEREISTEGIEISQWRVRTETARDFLVNFWDFGGQEVYHATHQFFLTKRSLYVFVWTARKDDDLTSFDYWLNVVKLLSDSSPVIVVLNKIDERTKAIDEKSIQEKFGNVVCFEKVSAKTGGGIAYLTERIRQHVAELPHVGDVLPRVWVDIRRRLEALDSNYISYEEYKGICREVRLDAERADFLSQYYHDLGTILHFQDNPVLKEVVFLKPEWATNAVYTLVDTKRVQEQHGEFEFAQLRAIWRNYPEDKHAHLLELMKKFELCFQIQGTQRYIVPELLRPAKPEFKWEYKGSLRFEYRYDFMPAGIVTRFIARVHDLIEGDLYWRSGVVLLRDRTRAVIIGERLNRRIRVWVRGEKRGELLAIIRREIDYIHRTLNDPDVKEMVPCICHECPAAEEPHFFEYEMLSRFHEKGRENVMCERSVQDVPIEGLLGTVCLREGLDVFISYAHRDLRRLGDFKRMLSPVTRDGQITVWSDKDIGVSQNWRVEIDRAMPMARAGLLLVSQAFLDSDFIMNHELPYLLRAREETQAKLYVAVLDQCLWEQTALAEIQASHDPSKPLYGMAKRKRDKVIKSICRKLVEGK